MLPEERLEKIIALLQEKKTIDNESLCSLLDVSISTVKRDLDLLEKRRVLRRTRGGAVLTKDYAETIHADFYGKDAMEAVRYAETVSK